MQNLTKDQIRGYINIRHCLGVKPLDIHAELVSTLGPHAPCQATVYNRIQRFNSGDESTKDKPRSGAPITETTGDNIERVRCLIQEDPHISLRDIEANTSISKTSVERILHDHLNLRKLHACWVPHKLTPEQKQTRLLMSQYNLAQFEEGKWRLCDVVTGDESWVYHRHIGTNSSTASWTAEGQLPPTQVKRHQFEPKSMICVFFKSTGPMHVDVLKKGKTIDNKYYIQNCLKPVVKEIMSQRPISGTDNMKILHDNAKPHVHYNVKKYLKTENLKLIDHPPYSPDLAPCDYWLFNEIKRRLPAQTDEKCLKSEITEILNSIPKEEYLKALKHYIERLKLCIKAEGDYFEHLMK